MIETFRQYVGEDLSTTVKDQGFNSFGLASFFLFFSRRHLFNVLSI
jgi:hypothetical protein